MNVTEILVEQARLRPSAPALIDPRSGAMSFAELEEASSRAAVLLRRAGLRKGDVVLVLLPMGTELYIALLALLRAGLVAMFPDPSAGIEEIGRCCARSAPQGVIAPSKYHLLRLCIPALRHIPVIFAVGMPVPGAISWRNRRREERTDIVPCDGEMPALMTFTSGSTGERKGLVRTHGFLLEQHRVLQECLGFGPGDVVLAGLPVFVLSHLATGASSVIPNVDLRHPDRIAPRPVIRQIMAWGVTGLEASPAFAERMAQDCLACGRALARIRKIFVGGAPVFPPLLDQMQAMAPGAKAIAVYGSSEAEPIALVSRDGLRPEDRAATRAGQGLLAGTPVEKISLRILRDQWGNLIGPFTPEKFDAASLPAGEAGEIVVEGNHVLKGYASGEDNSATKFQVGDRTWHRTGDAGYLDADGRLWLLGRCAARVADSSGVTYPLSVEAAVLEDTAVRRAAFFTRAGRRVCGIEPSERQQPDLGRIRARLGWARIDETRIWKRIPVDKRHNSKVDYVALAKMRSG